MFHVCIIELRTSIVELFPAQQLCDTQTCLQFALQMIFVDRR